MGLGCVRSVLILEQHLTLVFAAKEVPGEASPPKALIVATLDILSALCSVLMGDFEALMASDHAKIVPMVVAACQVRLLAPESWGGKSQFTGAVTFASVAVVPFVSWLCRTQPPTSSSLGTPCLGTWRSVPSRT